MPRPHARTIICLVSALTALLLVACNGDPSAGQRTDPRSLAPDDAALAALYHRSCFACHASASSSAPLTGDARAWAPRLSQGMAQLIDHVVDGYRGMPPMGLCMDCNADDFEALIHFMASPPRPAQEAR